MADLHEKCSGMIKKAPFQGKLPQPSEPATNSQNAWKGGGNLPAPHKPS
jgi:hypothetical protein